MRSLTSASCTSTSRSSPRTGARSALAPTSGGSSPVGTREAVKVGRMLSAGMFVGLAALGLTAGAAGAASVVHTPLPVSAASLTQDGQQLLWHVVLDHPFSPAAMKRAGRTLCLVLRRASNSSVSGVLCVAPPRDGRHPELVYQRVGRAGRAPGRPITAAVSRSST